jgi:hypothetical protein
MFRKPRRKINHARCPKDGGIVDCTVYVAIVQQPGVGRMLQSQTKQKACRTCQSVYTITIVKRDAEPLPPSGDDGLDEAKSEQDLGDDGADED